MLLYCDEIGKPVTKTISCYFHLYVFLACSTRAKTGLSTRAKNIRIIHWNAYNMYFILQKNETT